MRIKLGRRALVRTVVPCGCRTHPTDHQACEDVCLDLGCTQAAGIQRTHWEWRK